MDKIKEEENAQRELDKKRADELTESLLNEKMPINDFIDNCRKE
jgi:hypothetical protein